MTAAALPIVDPKSGRNAEVGAAIAIVGLIGLLIVPLPPILLDLFISLSIGISLVVLLLAAIYRAPLLALIPLLTVMVSVEVALSLLIWLTRLSDRSSVSPISFMVICS